MWRTKQAPLAILLNVGLAFGFGSFPVDGFGPTYSAEMEDLHCLRRQETRKSIHEVVRDKSSTMSCGPFPHSVRVPLKE